MELPWGGIIAFFGTLSLFVGSLTALYQGDSKRLLAFHSMGQIGYVLLAIGMGIAFRRVNPAISAVALIAGLFHLLVRPTIRIHEMHQIDFVLPPDATQSIQSSPSYFRPMVPESMAQLLPGQRW